MAHYTSSTSLDSMNIEFVGFDPESGEATVHLARVIHAEDSDETVWINHKFQVSLELLRAMTSEVDSLVESMADEGLTDFELRKPIQATV
jgi:hypothetical protein